MWKDNRCYGYTIIRAFCGGTFVKVNTISEWRMNYLFWNLNLVNLLDSVDDNSKTRFINVSKNDADKLIA